VKTSRRRHARDDGRGPGRDQEAVVADRLAAVEEDVLALGVDPFGAPDEIADAEAVVVALLLAQVRALLADLAVNKIRDRHAAVGLGLRLGADERDARGAVEAAQRLRRRHARRACAENDVVHGLLPERDQVRPRSCIRFGGSARAWNR
jgi:hypothetical protein